MNPWIRLVLVSGLLLGSAPPQETLSDSVLRTVKEATVYIRTSRATGSGFIIRREGRSALVLTCAHVLRESAGHPVIGVWHPGTPDQVAVSLKLVGIDPAGDLAVLRCELKDPPAPLPLAPATRLKETLPAFVVGFPFGEGLSGNSQFPSPTIGKASVAALKTDEFGALRLLQLDGEINPGNSGGPVVDGRGAVIGMAAMRVSDSKISFAVASTDIAEMVEGRAFPPVLVGLSGDEQAVKVRVFVGLVDPMKRIRNPVLLLVPRIKLPGPPKPGDKGAWGAISDEAEELPLKVADGVIEQEITVRKGESDEGRFVAQLRYARDGATRWTAPVNAQFDFKPKPAPPKAPDAGPPAGAPAPDKGPALGFDVRLDDAGRDAILIRQSPEGSPVSFKQYQWKDRDGGAHQILSPDLKTAYVFTVTAGRATSDSTLVRKIAVETLREERALHLGRSFRSPQWTALGILITSSWQQGRETEALILDPGTLQVVGHLTGFGNTFVTQRESPIALTFEGEWVSFFDLKKNAVVNRVSLSQLASRKEKPKIGAKANLAREFKTTSWTADGKFLVVAYGGGLHRFRVRGTDLVYEEAGPRIGREPTFILTPDSSAALVVTVPEEIEKYREKGQEKERTNHLIDERWLFRVESLAVPSARLRPFHSAHPIGFDPTGAVLFSRAGAQQVFSCRKIQRIGIDGRMIGLHDDVPISSGVHFLSPTRMMTWDMGVRIWEFQD